MRLATICIACEAFTALLTVAYCGVVLHDVTSSPGSRLSSDSWRMRTIYGSVQLQTCFHQPRSLRDLRHRWWFPAAALECCGVEIHNRSAQLVLVPAIVSCREAVPLQLAAAVSVFTMLHGLAHGVIGYFGGLNAEVLDNFRPQKAPPLLAVAVFIALASFLAVGPFVGYVHGVPLSLCSVIHAVSILLFLVYVPLQFAFGAVQLVLNFWICLPRLLLISASEPTQAEERERDGWPVISIGVLLLMPVVFSEMLLCDAFVKAASGHLLYDSSLLLLTAAYSISIRPSRKAD
eukprot:s2251_g5.t3